jgi:serine/threonine-protein kinase
MRVVVADDSLLFRAGLVGLLERRGFDVIGEAGDKTELLSLVSALKPDLAVVDIRMPPTFTTEGLVAAAELADLLPGVGVAVLSQFLESDFAVQLLQEGTAGRGYLLKDQVANIDDFVASLERVGNGGCVVDPGVVSALMQRNRRSGPIDALSEREREILQLMAEGYSNNGIGEQLFLSSRTVESHVRALFQKLNLSETHELNRRVLAVMAFLQAQT